MHIQAGFLKLIDRTLYRDDDPSPVKLLPKEARLLAVLMQSSGQVVSRAKLMKEVWQTDYLGDTRTLDVHICWLRHKLETEPAHPRLIMTRRGVGYWLNLSQRSP